MSEIKETGGCRVGWLNASWPFATLSANSESLKLETSIVGTLSFSPSSVIELKPYTLIPFLAQGIKIIHNIADYNSYIVFWTFKKPEKLLKQIQETGFHAKADSFGVPQSVHPSALDGFPLNHSVLLVLFFVWNAFFLIDITKMFLGPVQGSPLGIGAMLATGSVVLFSLLLLLSVKVRNICLKENRKIEEIKKLLYFVIIVCSFVFIGVILTQ